MSKIVSTGTLRRHAVRLALLAVAFASVIGVTAGSASAYTVDSNGTLQGFGGCYTSAHQMSMSGNFMPSTRFPNGVWILTRYAYWSVNPSAQRTSGYGYTATKQLFAQPGTLYNHTVLGGPESYGQWTSLPTVTINVSGRLRMAVQVGVWNGPSYEWLPWDTARTYALNGQPINTTTCAASLG